MSNLPAVERDRLASVFSITSIEKIKETKSGKSKTTKILFKTFDGNMIEAVLIADKNDEIE